MSKYQLWHGVRRALMAVNARSLRVKGDNPGGQLKHFCVPL